MWSVKAKEKIADLCWDMANVLRVRDPTPRSPHLVKIQTYLKWKSLNGGWLKDSLLSDSTCPGTMYGDWKTTCRRQLPPSTMWVAGIETRLCGKCLYLLTRLLDLIYFYLIRRSNSSWVWAFVVEKGVLRCQNQLPKSQFNFSPHCILSTAHFSHHT